LDERLWSRDEIPRKTEHPRILRLERKEASRIDLEALLARLEPVCRYDRQNPESYRNEALLRSILREAIPELDLDAGRVPPKGKESP
ncbi:MAG: polysaccharide biosynthesis protein, partial [Treponema sp.]|nr:polysaccharide biosynthesis protein [Treponema sp.]